MSDAQFRPCKEMDSCVPQIFARGRCGSTLGTLFISCSSSVCSMTLIYGFNQAWYILLLAFLFSWAGLLVARRKSQVRREIKEQVFLAFSGLFALGLMEFFAVSTNL